MGVGEGGERSEKKTHAKTIQNAITPNGNDMDAVRIVNGIYNSYDVQYAHKQQQQ